MNVCVFVHGMKTDRKKERTFGDFPTHFSILSVFLALAMLSLSTIKCLQFESLKIPHAGVCLSPQHLSLRQHLLPIQ